MSTRRKPTSGDPRRHARYGRLSTDGTVFPGSRARPGLLDDPTPGKHRWIATVTHVLTDESAAAAHRGDQVLLDMENVAFIGTGCWNCEQPYSPDVAARPCGGEPR